MLEQGERRFPESVSTQYRTPRGMMRMERIGRDNPVSSTIKIAQAARYGDFCFDVHACVSKIFEEGNWDGDQWSTLLDRESFDAGDHV